MDIRGKSVLVTGGCGFIGSNLVARLIDEMAFVTVLDDLFNGEAKNLPDKHTRLDFIEGSVTDCELVKQLVDKVQLVFHLACRNIVVSTTDPRSDFEVNTAGTFNVLQAATEKNVKVVYSSSASVYGNPKHLPVNEDDGISPLSPYAASKMSGEHYCQVFYEQYGLPTTTLRYSNVYGNQQSRNERWRSVITSFFDKAMAGKPIQIHGDGEQTRDFTYVDDVVEATLRAGVSPRADGHVYNVSSGIETSVNTLAGKVVAICGRGSVEHIDRRDIDAVRRRVCSSERIRRDLRWTPTITLDEGLRRTYEWLKSS